MRVRIEEVLLWFVALFGSMALVFLLMKVSGAILSWVDSDVCGEEVTVLRAEDGRTFCLNERSWVMWEEGQ